MCFDNEERFKIRKGIDQFKTDMKNLTNFDRVLENLKNWLFNGLILTTVYNDSAQKVQRSYV